MFDISHMFANLELGWNDNLDDLDLNRNGVLDINDCPFPSGSTEAKLWWINILEPYVQSQLTSELLEEHGDSIIGVYKGKPLISGESSYGSGNHEFLVDKIRLTKGLSYSSANKVAAKVTAMY